MSYRIAGIDVHKKVLAVVVSDAEVDGEYQFARRMFGSNPEQLQSLRNAAFALLIRIVIVLQTEVSAISQ